MNIIPTSLRGLLIVEPKVFQDSRGYFMETYHQDRYREYGIDPCFVQDNLSYSVQGTLRGLHYQIKHAQAKLVQVISGEIYDVAVDIRDLHGDSLSKGGMDKARVRLVVDHAAVVRAFRLSPTGVQTGDIGNRCARTWVTLSMRQEPHSSSVVDR